MLAGKIIQNCRKIPQVAVLFFFFAGSVCVFLEIKLKLLDP